MRISTIAVCLALGSFALPRAVEAINPVDPCAAGTVISASALCSSSGTPNPDNTTTFSYLFGHIGFTTVYAYIPLLDPNAINPGTFLLDALPAIPTIITGAAVATDWGFYDGIKPGFSNPAALIQIALPPSDVPNYTSVSFVSNDPLIQGPIKVDTNFSDPPLPGVIPEPGTLAIFGLALAGLGFARGRRKAT